MAQWTRRPAPETTAGARSDLRKLRMRLHYRVCRIRQVRIGDQNVRGDDDLTFGGLCELVTNQGYALPRRHFHDLTSARPDDQTFLARIRESRNPIRHDDRAQLRLENIEKGNVALVAVREQRRIFRERRRSDNGSQVAPGIGIPAVDQRREPRDSRVEGLIRRCERYGCRLPEQPVQVRRGAVPVDHLVVGRIADRVDHRAAQGSFPCRPWSARSSRRTRN